MGVDNILFWLLNLVAVDPERIIRGCWHAEGSHVLFVCVVECTDVVGHIEAELVVFVKEYVVNCH